MWAVGTARELMPLIMFSWRDLGGERAARGAPLAPVSWRRNRLCARGSNDFEPQHCPRTTVFGEFRGQKERTENDLFPKKVLDMLNLKMGFQEERPEVEVREPLS